MLHKLDEVTDERIKALGEIKKYKLRIAIIRESRRSSFKSETLFGRRFCLLGPKVANLKSDHQFGKNHIKSRK
jgi:hypothetical protein